MYLIVFGENWRKSLRKWSACEGCWQPVTQQRETVSITDFYVLFRYTLRVNITFFCGVIVDCTCGALVTVPAVRDKLQDITGCVRVVCRVKPVSVPSVALYLGATADETKEGTRTCNSSQ